MQINFKNWTTFQFFPFIVSPVKSSNKSSFKNSMVSNSFYGKQKAVYLTPLERKAIKELLPSPPPLPPLPLSQEKKKRSVKRGKKRTKAAAGSRNPGKMGIGRYMTSAKTAKQAKMNSRFDYLLYLYNYFADNKDMNVSINCCINFNGTWKVLFVFFLCVDLFNSRSDKPASTSAAAPACSTKTTESKKTLTFTSFSSLKPKPKIFVGAAFFITGKKPTSMYKKTTVKSSSRLTSAQIKSQTDQKAKQLPSHPPVSVIKQQNPAEVCTLQGYTHFFWKHQ